MKVSTNDAKLNIVTDMICRLNKQRGQSCQSFGFCYIETKSVCCLSENCAYGFQRGRHSFIILWNFLGTKPLAQMLVNGCQVNNYLSKEFPLKPKPFMQVRADSFNKTYEKYEAAKLNAIINHAKVEI